MGSRSPIPKDFRGTWTLLPHYRTKDYPEGASFDMDIDQYRVKIDYDLMTKAPSLWTPDGFHPFYAKEIQLESAEQTPRTARMRYSPNKIKFDGPYYMEFERKGTQEESQLGVGLLFIVVFFFAAFYLSKK